MRIYTVVCAVIILLTSSGTGADARVIGGTLDHAVAVYYFDRPTNAGQIFDYSGNGLHGNLFSGAELTWVSGRQCLSLSSHAAVFSAEDDNKPLSVSKEFSIVAWVKVPIEGTGFLIGITAYTDQNTDEGHQGSVEIDVKFNGTLSGAYAYNSTDDITWEVVKATGKRVNNDRWQHVAYVVSRNSMKLYLNGTRIANRSVSAHLSFNGTGSFVSMGYEARGSVDNVGFFKNDLTDAQVKLIYDSGLPFVIGIAPVDPSGKVATTWAALKKK